MQSCVKEDGCGPTGQIVSDCSIEPEEGIHALSAPPPPPPSPPSSPTLPLQKDPLPPDATPPPQPQPLNLSS